MPPIVAYPAWYYHAIHGKRLVMNPEEEAALGNGWVDSPAKVEAQAPEAEDKPKRGAKA